MPRFTKAPTAALILLTLSACALYNAHIKANLINREMLDLYRRGRYAEAIPKAEAVLALRSENLGPDHPYVATTLNDLAELYRNLGRYEEAKPLYEKALAIWERRLGPDHRYVATGINNLATLLIQLGDLASAVPLQERALDLRIDRLGPDHPAVAQSHNNLAETHRRLENDRRAEEHYRKALAIYESLPGALHPELGQLLDNMASFHHNRGEYARAGAYYRRALALKKKTLDPDHPDVALCVNNLAYHHRDLGRYEEAKPLYEDALARFRERLGDGHPLTAMVEGNLAELAAAAGAPAEALGRYRRALAIDDRLILQVLGFTADRERLAFLATVRTRLNLLLSLVNAELAADPGARTLALDAWLRRKGITLEAQRRFREALLYGDDPRSMAIFQRLARVRSRISGLIFAGPEAGSPEETRKRIEDLERTADRLEGALNRISARYARARTTAAATSGTLADRLASGTALVEFARIDAFDFRAPPDRRWGPSRYLAFVLLAGDPTPAALVDLGEAGAIDKAVDDLKKGVSGSGRAAHRAFRRAGRKLYERIFAPLRPHLEEVREIFLSPDGRLGLVPFEILIAPDGRFLIETHTFNYLAAGRDLAGFGASAGSTGKALLLGDPDFDAALPDAVPPDTERVPGDGGQRRRSVDLDALAFDRLPGTRLEVTAIHRLLGAAESDIFTGAGATEAAVRRADSPRILHLATHGFFLGTPDPSAGGPADRGIWTAGAPAPPRRARSALLTENPLLRSGLVLAGANRTLRSGDPSVAEGLLTAEKILGLDLLGTEMVVLSACETGVGRVEPWEGVWGLRRAFLQAGARSLVMSLWSIPDRESQELMVAFHENLIADPSNRCRALRRAALAEMAVVKDRYGYPHPLFWGGFVFLGEP